MSGDTCPAAASHMLLSTFVLPQAPFNCDVVCPALRQQRTDSAVNSWQMWSVGFRVSEQTDYAAQALAPCCEQHQQALGAHPASAAAALAASTAACS